MTDLLPIIKRTNYNTTNATFPENWYDVDPMTGTVLGTVQKYLVSVIIEKDVLFDRDLIIPIYYSITTGEYDEDMVILANQDSRKIQQIL